MSNQTSLPLVCNRYRLEAMISDSPKTKICSVIDEAGNRFAAKMTSVNETDQDGGSFIDEVEVFNSLTNGQISFGHQTTGPTPEGFPNVYYVGNHAGEYNVIVMDKLFPDLLYLCHHQKLTMKTYQQLACEMLDRLEELHRHGFVHRDVKPQNFMMNGQGKVHLIDFGLSKRFRDVRTNAHLPEGREPFLCGTLIYCSVNAQRLITQSRRDDLESLGYSVIEMIKKSLPWEEAYDFEDDVERHLSYMKEHTTLETLCRGLPMGIYEYMVSVSAMSYSESPQYCNLREMLNRG